MKTQMTFNGQQFEAVAALDKESVCRMMARRVKQLLNIPARSVAKDGKYLLMLPVSLNPHQQAAFDRAVGKI